MARTVLLVGCGKMGSALLKGWLSTDPGADITVIDPQADPVPFLAAVPCARVTWLSDLSDLPATTFRPQVVVLAVKPQMLDPLLPAYAAFAGPHTVFLSIAAGKSLDGLQAGLGAQTAIVRSMPNTPAAIGRGVTVAIANRQVSPDQRELCDGLLRAVGDVAWINDESLMDAVTAVSGSGPAYVFLLAETLAAAGQAAGLPADLAMHLARQTLAGAGELLYRTSESAATLRQNVTSPGGTTEAALAVLMAEPEGLAALMRAAVAAAARRSQELRR